MNKISVIHAGLIDVSIGIINFSTTGIISSVDILDWQFSKINTKWVFIHILTPSAFFFIYIYTYLFLYILIYF